MTRPYRKDGYVHRRRVHIRMDDRLVEKLDALASSLRVSRSHLCDLILVVAIDDDSRWLSRRIETRIRKSLEQRKIRWE